MSIVYQWSQMKNIIVKETAFIVSPVNKVWSLKSKLCFSWSFISKILTFTTSLNNFAGDTRQTNALVNLQGIITVSITERVKVFQRNDSSKGRSCNLILSTHREQTDEENVILKSTKKPPPPVWALFKQFRHYLISFLL